MSEAKKNPCLYILMRADMASMTPGRAAAQASHATSAFLAAPKPPGTDVDVELWKAQTNQGFGTVIVLATDAYGMDSIVKALYASNVCGIVTDPTYPLQDGDVVHEIPVETCAFVFVRDRNEANGDDMVWIREYPLF